MIPGGKAAVSAANILSSLQKRHAAELSREREADFVRRTARSARVRPDPQIRVWMASKKG